MQSKSKTTRKEVHKKLATLQLAKEAAIVKLNSFEGGGILNEWKNSDDQLIGFKVIPPTEEIGDVTVFKI